MFARVDFSTLTLKDALDLACLIEQEAFDRYSQFAEQLGYRTADDAAAWFRTMALNEKKHGEELAARRSSLFGKAPSTVSPDDVFDVEAPEQGAPHRKMSQRDALKLALASEQKAFTFFSEALPYVKDRDVRALFEELRDEESEHIRLVEKHMAALPPQSADELEDVDELE
jgi:rubrerythrin